MTRIFLAIATAFFAAMLLFDTTAQACISCEYTPQVVNTPNPLDAKRKSQKRHQAGKKQRSPSAAKSQARKAKASKKVQESRTTKKTEPVPTASEPEIATAEPGPPVPGEPEPRLTGSAALMQQRMIEQEDEPVAAADAEDACKKFIPAVGATVSVPCE